MFNLFKTEILRYRTLALGIALFHFAVLYYLYTLGATVLQSMQALIWLMVCMGLAAGFGAFQMSQHRRDNDWRYLMHRPLPRPKIFLALTLAGAVISLFIAVAPLALITVIMHGNGMYGVELRFYQTIPYAIAAALTAYWCGCFAMLSSSRLGLFALGMLAPFLAVEPDSELLISSMMLLAWGLLVARSAFKPDLSQPPRHLRALLLTELPIQSGCLLLITLATAWIAGLGQWLSGYDRVLNPLPGSDDFVRAMSAKESMQYGLERSSHPDARRLSQQLALGETIEAGIASFNRHPRRGQLPLIDEALVLADGKVHALWRFRHDVMLFEGRNLDSAEFLGWLAPDGFHQSGTTVPTVRFDSVPAVSTAQYIISDKDIYQVSWEDRQVHHRYHNNDMDRFNNSLSIGENISTLLSDSRLYLFNTAALRDAEVELSPSALLDVPSTDGPDLRKLAILPLNDGYLISTLLDQTPFSSSPDFASLGHARFELHRVNNDNAAELIALVELSSGAGEWSLYKHFVMSPGIRLFNDLVTGLRQHKSTEATLPLLYVQFPSRIYLAAGLVCLLCAGVTAWVLRRSTLPLRVRMFWVVGNGLTGLAGLLSFYMGYYWKRGDLLRAETASPVGMGAAALQTRGLGYN